MSLMVLCLSTAAYPPSIRRLNLAAWVQGALERYACRLYAAYTPPTVVECNDLDAYLGAVPSIRRFSAKTGQHLLKSRLFSSTICTCGLRMFIFLESSP
jgi:hypothetical protein